MLLLLLVLSLVVGAVGHEVCAHALAGWLLARFRYDRRLLIARARWSRQMYVAAFLHWVIFIRRMFVRADFVLLTCADDDPINPNGDVDGSREFFDWVAPGKRDCACARVCPCAHIAAQAAICLQRCHTTKTGVCDLCVDCVRYYMILVRVDYIVWNGHRVYGPIRRPMIMEDVGWIVKGTVSLQNLCVSTSLHFTSVFVIGTLWDGRFYDHDHWHELAKANGGLPDWQFEPVWVLQKPPL